MAHLESVPEIALIHLGAVAYSEIHLGINRGHGDHGGPTAQVERDVSFKRASDGQHTG